MPFHNITTGPRRPLRPTHAAALILLLLLLGYLFAGTPQDNREPLELPAATFPVFEETTTTTVAVGEPPAPTTTAVEIPPIGATATATAVRGTRVELEPPPATWVPGDCESFRYLLELHAPAGGWNVDKMIGFGDRETRCCPSVQLRDGTWRVTRGGDRFQTITDDDGTMRPCQFSHVARWDHRSDAGLLQINGINYDPARCDPCLHHTLDMLEPLTAEQLADPVLNIRAAAALCTTTRAWGWGCYSAWGG